jgi:hypothetical protein
MKRMFIIIAAILAFAITAPAANPTAICPFDGQSAWITGQTRHDGKECQYSHIRFVYGRDGLLSETKHAFWHACD